MAYLSETDTTFGKNTTYINDLTRPPGKMRDYFEKYAAQDPKICGPN